MRVSARRYPEFRLSRYSGLRAAWLILCGVVLALPSLALAVDDSLDTQADDSENEVLK